MVLYGKKYNLSLHSCIEKFGTRIENTLKTRKMFVTWIENN